MKHVFTKIVVSSILVALLLVRHGVSIQSFLLLSGMSYFSVEKIYNYFYKLEIYAGGGAIKHDYEDDDTRLLRLFGMLGGFGLLIACFWI